MTTATLSILCLLSYLLVSEANPLSNSKDSGIGGSWCSLNGLILNINQNSNNALTGKVSIRCEMGYRLTGSSSNKNIFYLTGALGKGAIAITGEHFDSNGNEMLVVTVLHTLYQNCPGAMPTKIYTYQATRCNRDAVVFDFPLAKKRRGCSLTGTWSNNYGCNVTIGAVNNRSFEGTYITGEESIGTSGVRQKITGSIADDKPAFSLGFIKATQTRINVFSGQCVENRPGEYLLETQWVQVDKQGKPSSKSFYTNSDVFHKIPTAGGRSKPRMA